MGNLNEESLKTLYEKVTKELIKQNKSISTMESCTSGLIASLITDTEGASGIFKGASVTYSNEYKIREGVNPEIIEKYGVYSKECAEEMARVIQKKNGVDIAIGITGSTGNVDPNNGDSIPGSVDYAIAMGREMHLYHYELETCSLSRAEIKKVYAGEVFNSLWDLLNNQK